MGVVAVCGLDVLMPHESLQVGRRNAGSDLPYAECRPQAVEANSASSESQFTKRTRQEIRQIIDTLQRRIETTNKVVVFFA